MEYRITPGRLEIGKFLLYYERVGAGAPIVFLHGLGGNHLSWWQQVPYFMRSFECVTVDQRGFGLSPDPDGLFNRAHASDLGALLDHLKIDKAVLIGQSMGGWTIVGYALEHPERVAAMVMADTPGGIFTPEMKFETPREPLAVDASPPIGS
jgi:3-oxoadipate enol-lactonase